MRNRKLYIIRGENKFWALPLNSVNTTTILLIRSCKIYPANQGIDFCGYRIWLEKILPRKRNIKAEKLRFKNLSKKIVYQDISIRTIQSKIASFSGYCKHCNSRRTYYSAINNLGALDNIISEVKANYE